MPWYEPEGAEKVRAAVAPPPSGGGVPFGDASGTAVTIPNTVKGSGNAQVAQYAGHTLAFAIKKDTDAHPWFVIVSDDDGIYIGDGSYDPFSGGVNIYASGSGGNGFHVVSPGPFNITGSGDCTVGAGNVLDVGGTHATRVFGGAHGDGLILADAGSSLELTGTADLEYLLNLKLNDQTPAFAINSHGVITVALLQSEDASLHQLQVANDGTLSTIPFP